MKVEGSVSPLRESIALVLDRVYLPLAGPPLVQTAKIN
jgi:hypothetical protein